VTGRELSPAERRQRAKAALKSGAFSGVRIRALSDVFYDRHMWRLNAEHGPTTPRQRMIVRDIADCDAQIRLADDWLDAQEDPLFKDRGTGELWPIVDRRRDWARTRATLYDKLPDGSAEPLGLSRRFGGDRR
jgi:hypothetical protein